MVMGESSSSLTLLRLGALESKVDQINDSLSRILQSEYLNLSSSATPNQTPRQESTNNTAVPDRIQETPQDPTKSEKIDRTTHDISSSLTPMNPTASSSPLPTYPEVKSPTLAHLRNRMDLIKGVLIGIEKERDLSDVKPPPPKSPAADDNGIFVAWCHSQGCAHYKRALARIMEELQAQEYLECKSLIAQGKVQGRNGDSIYRNHLRSKILAAKRAVTDFHLNKQPGVSKPDLKYASPAMDDDIKR
ncbi:hypothetical protein BGX27_005697 [Mortierella sp. AM989]|nr:hypothetical protein BGX27_005697 [Mortierella sp. AM989]